MWCLHGKVDTTINYFHMCVHVLLAPPTVLGLWSIVLVLWLPIKYYIIVVFLLILLLLGRKPILTPPTLFHIIICCSPHCKLCYCVLLYGSCLLQSIPSNKEDDTDSRLFIILQTYQNMMLHMTSQRIMRTLLSMEPLVP